jgi:hypothetical protein
MDQTQQAARKRVAIESPYRPKGIDPVREPERYRAAEKRNEEYAEKLCRFAVDAGFNPYAMHLFFTRFLDDKIEAHRNSGITMGLGWTDLAEEVWFGLTPGAVLSTGMRIAIDRNTALFPERPVRILLFTQSGQLVGGDNLGPLEPLVRAPF